MRILVDAMGGDNAPDQIALGAIQAAKDFPDVQFCHSTGTKAHT